MKHLFLKTTALLAAVTVLAVGITCLTATVRPVGSGTHIVTSFYPVYIAARHVVGDTDGVTLTNMVDRQTGCLHDYQMSPSDRVTLSEADIFIMNGAGAEPFLNDALTLYPQLPIVDLSDGQTLLASGHLHNAPHEDEQEAGEAEVNSHLWVSPLRYRQQVETLCDGLCETDPAHAAAYQANAQTYLAQIDAIWERLQAAVARAGDLSVVLLHDSLVYLAEDLDLPVIASLEMGEESGASAADLASAEDALRGAGKVLFLYDAQYDAAPYAYLQTLPASATAIAVDTGVAGDDDADSWLNAMEQLITDWEAAV